MDVTIIGPGNMGRALSTRLVAGGHRIWLVGEDRQQAEDVAAEVRESAGANAQVEAADLDTAVAASDVVILALPYQVLLETVREHGQRLAGKIVIDISNPLNESYTALVTGADSSGAETVRALLPPTARLVKAFNTTFARTLVTGEVSGQPLDVFIAGDDQEANERVAELARTSGLRPIVVGGLERARQLEALGFLGISMQESLGTGFMTGWKLVFPGTEPPRASRFLQDAVIGVMPDTSSIAQIVTELAAIGVEQSRVHLLMGAEGAATLREAQRSGRGVLGALFGFEAEHTRLHLREVETGRVVIVVEVADDELGEQVGQVLARHGALYANYYSRWTARKLF